MGASALPKKLKINNPLDACPIHGFVNFWGCLCSGIFASDFNIANTYGNFNTAMSFGEQIGVQFVGALSSSLAPYHHGVDVNYFEPYVLCHQKDHWAPGE
jgi:ammonia channel protein AmtB